MLIATCWLTDVCRCRYVGMYCTERDYRHTTYTPTHTHTVYVTLRNAAASANLTCRHVGSPGGNRNILGVVMWIFFPPSSLHATYGGMKGTFKIRLTTYTSFRNNYVGAGQTQLRVGKQKKKKKKYALDG